jgi:choline dehydrogenase-like flavoprotein
MEVDTLIIGSGVAAAALSQRMLERNPRASILLLEAGQRVKTKDFGLWEHYLVTGQLPYEQCWDYKWPARDYRGENAAAPNNDANVELYQARVFAYGGSTLHWGGWSFRLKPEDFKLFSNTGTGGDWPFGYETLECFYGQAEEYLAVSGDSDDKTVHRTKRYPFDPFPFTLEDQPIAEAFEKLNVSYGKMPIARRGVSDKPSRHAPCQTTGTCKYCPFGARYVASNYLDDLREWYDLPNFNVQLGAVAETLLLSEKSKVAGVRYRDVKTGETAEIRAQRVIIAAGTIESAKLLLRSHSPEWPNGVGNSYKLAGAHLITHPYFMFSGKRDANPRRLQPEMNFPTLVSRHFDSVEEQKKGGKFLLVNPPDSTSVDVSALMQSGYSRDAIDGMLSGKQTVNLHGMIEVAGDQQNRVDNLDQLNHLGLPQTKVTYRKPENFKQRMADIKLQAQKIYSAMHAELVDDPVVSWRADHAASTCRMSARESDGVVDQNLRVWGLDNLYVCSNAVFPSLGAINPTLTLTALSLRLAKHLNDSLAPDSTS